jgi:hypothetical protein
MRPGPALAAVLAAAAVAACSSAPATAAPAGTTAAPHSPSPARTAAPATGAPGPVVGVNLYALRSETAAQTAADGARTLSYIKDTLHAGAVDLVWNMYAPAPASDSVTATAAGTLTAPDIGILTRIAQGDGLEVEYRPLLFVQSTGDTWEGSIKPADPAAWFGSYYAANLPYLQQAQKYGISEYVIGTEMDGVSPDPQWPSFLARAARVFTGEISYTADQVDYFPPHTQLPATKLTGVDMYEALRLPSPVQASAVTAAYEKFFAALPVSLLQRTAIQETGIEARAGAYGNPPNLGETGRLDESVQFNWFAAGCEAVRRFHLRGIFFWKVDLADSPVTHPASSLSTFEGKEGATAIGDCAGIIDGDPAALAAFRDAAKEYK